jgi:hypothetical protein
VRYETLLNRDDQLVTLSSASHNDACRLRQPALRGNALEIVDAADRDPRQLFDQVTFLYTCALGRGSASD